MTCGTDTLCYKINKPYSCPSSKYLRSDEQCYTSCDSPNDPNFIPNLNTSTYNGYCNSVCNTSNECMAQKSLTDYSQFVCKTTFTKSFYFCYAAADDNKGALHYGSMFSPPRINIPINPSLSNYHLEIWYLPDPRFLSYSIATGWYFFETNSFNCKKTSQSVTTINDYACYYGNTKIGTDVTMKYLNWQRLAFSVSGTGTNYNFSFHFNKYNAATASQNISSNLILSSINFCTTSCSNQQWASGFYKWLKIYDATFLPLSVFKAKDIM